MISIPISHHQQARSSSISSASLEIGRNTVELDHWSSDGDDVGTYQSEPDDEIDVDGASVILSPDCSLQAHEPSLLPSDLQQVSLNNALNLCQY